MSVKFDGIILRRPELKDVDRLYSYKNDWEVIKGLGGFSSGYSLSDIEDWVEYHRKKSDEVLWAIAEKDNDQCIGHVGLYDIDHRVRSAEFAIMIGEKSFWGKGLGKTITAAVLDYGFEQLNLHRIYLSVLSANERALCLYEKLGFKKEGVLRHDQFRNGQYLDVTIMGILEDER